MLPMGACLYTPLIRNPITKYVTGKALRGFQRGCDLFSHLYDRTKRRVNEVTTPYQIYSRNINSPEANRTT